MLKLTGHLTTLTALSIFCLLIGSGCRFFQPTAYFFISNKSQDKKAVDIIVNIAGHDVYKDTLKWTDIRPDLQYTPDISLPKGKYMITVIADNGRVNEKQPIVLDSDRFIFITYTYTAPVDSATAVKKYGFLYSEKLLKGQEQKVGIYITDKEPVHM